MCDQQTALYSEANDAGPNYAVPDSLVCRVLVTVFMISHSTKTVALLKDVACKVVDVGALNCVSSNLHRTLLQR